jgi:hypothetical protein
MGLHSLRTCYKKQKNAYASYNQMVRERRGEKEILMNDIYRGEAKKRL